MLNVAQDNISIVDNGDVPIELGDVANIRKARRNTQPIPRPKSFLDVVHCDIGYGDCKAVGGAKYCVLLADRTTQNTWIYALKDLTHKSLIAVFEQFRLDAGSLPRRLYTDFDDKILGGPTGEFYAVINVRFALLLPNGRIKTGLLRMPGRQPVTWRART